MCSCHSILECCVMFSGVKLSIRSFVLFIIIIKHYDCVNDILYTYVVSLTLEERVVKVSANNVPK